MDYMACGSEYYGRGGSEGQENIEKPQEQALPRQENKDHTIFSWILYHGKGLSAMRINEIKQQFQNGATRIVFDDKVAFPTYEDKKLIGADIYRQKPNGVEMWKRVTFRC